MMTKKALTIAGFDPTGGAGLQRDLITFNDFKLTGFSVSTASTVQDGIKVYKVNHIKAAVIKDQLEALQSVSGVKTGMLATKENVLTVKGYIKKTKPKHFVIDTVLSSSSGVSLLNKNAVKDYMELMKMATVITPNILEAETLTNTRIKNIETMKEACLSLKEMGVKATLLKGGHLKGEPVDILFYKNKFYEYKGKRIKASKKNLHGTGCILSSALLSNLINNEPMDRAVGKAKRYLEKSIKARKG